MRSYNQAFKTYSGHMPNSQPISISHNLTSTKSSLFSKQKLQKKCSEQQLPKYLLKGRHALQKQNILYEIQVQTKKLKKQNFKKAVLENKLNQKQFKLERKTLSIKKFKQSYGANIQEGLERIISRDNVGLRRIPSGNGNNYILNKQSSIFKSIQDQLQGLNIQFNNNQKTIQELKRSKKYTRYIQNQQESSIFISQLQQMKQHLKRLKLEIIKNKRIHKQNKKQRINELLLQGEIQDSIQRQNIEIYELIQQKNRQIKQVSIKKCGLIKKRQKILQQIEKLKQKYNIRPEEIEVYYQSIFGSHNKNKIVCNSQNGISVYKTNTGICDFSANSKTKQLKVLKQEDFQEDEDSRQILAQTAPTVIKTKQNSKKDSIKQDTAVQTVKIYSNVDSENGDFMGVDIQGQIGISRGQKNGQIKQNSFKTNNLYSKKKHQIQKLEKKYFYQDNSQQEEQEDEQFQVQQNLDNEPEEDQYSGNQNIQQEQQQSADEVQKKYVQCMKRKQKKKQMTTPLIINKDGQSDQQDDSQDFTQEIDQSRNKAKNNNFMNKTNNINTKPGQNRTKASQNAVIGVGNRQSRTISL